MFDISQTLMGKFYYPYNPDTEAGFFVGKDHTQHIFMIISQNMISLF